MSDWPPHRILLCFMCRMLGLKRCLPPCANALESRR